MAGLVPILWSTGAGSEVMQRIAVPMIGGMVSSTLLTLVVIPAIYALIKGIGLPAGQDNDRSRHEEAGVGGSGSGSPQVTLR
jgi:Cu(I)/Ag(I) efflux system membrane protein CusA/SilA